MKVKNQLKAVLNLKASNGEKLEIQPEGVHTFKKEELSFFQKSVDAYIKSGWLKEETSQSEEESEEAKKAKALQKEEAKKAKALEKEKKAKAKQDAKEKKAKSRRR